VTDGQTTDDNSNVTYTRSAKIESLQQIHNLLTLPRPTPTVQQICNIGVV